MEFIRTDDWQPGLDALAGRLKSELSAGKKTLWFVTGGSNIKHASSIMEQLDDELTGNLTITLTDERYGAVGHPDSNWQQLIDNGFNFKQAKQLPVLIGDLPLEATRAAYEASLGQALDESEAIIGQFGMGPDGHICGILPGSPAVGIIDLVAAYVTPTFTRITSTFSTIKRCQTGYLLAYGDDKKAPLLQLQNEVSLNEQPAQILKQLPEAYVYNDQLGGEQ